MAAENHISSVQTDKGQDMAGHERERVTQDRREAIGFGMQNVKWVFSSLLLLNGAGLIALLNKADQLPAPVLHAAHSFAAGLVAALGGGALAAFFAFAAAARFDWQLRNQEAYSNIGFIAQVLSGIVALGFLIFSIFLFSMGVVEVGGAIGVDAPSKTLSVQSSPSPQ